MTPASTVVVRLTGEQRQTLRTLIRTGTHTARARARAHLLPKADADGPEAWPDERSAAALGVCRPTVSRVRQPFAAEGPDATPHKERAAARPYRPPDGAQEARLTARTCSPPPEGRARWAMKLLADELVELEVAGSTDPATVWRALTRRPRAVARAAVGHPAPGRCGARSGRGGRARRPRPAL